MMSSFRANPGAFQSVALSSEWYGTGRDSQKWSIFVMRMSGLTRIQIPVLPSTIKWNAGKDPMSDIGHAGDKITLARIGNKRKDG